MGGVCERVIEDVHRAITADRELEVGVTFPSQTETAMALVRGSHHNVTSRSSLVRLAELAPCRRRGCVGCHGYSLLLPGIRSLGSRSV